jgi:hypothetical protein
LAAGAEDEEDGVHADAVGGGRPPAAEAVGVLAPGDELGDGLPEVVGDAPVIGDRTFVHEDTCEERPAARPTSAATSRGYRASGVIRIGSKEQE